MLLTIDIGNTNIKFGVFNNDTIVSKTRVATNKKKTADELSVELYTLFEINKIKSEDIEGAIISSVVPNVTSKMKEAVQNVLGIDALVVGPGVKTGLNIQIYDPSQLGADLVTGCVALSQKCDMPAILISLGTATAICVLDKDKNMKGGLIAPGVNVSLEALSSQSSLLYSVSLDPPKSVIGKSTDESMRAGIVIGFACMIDGLIDKIQEEVGSKCEIIATGGLAKKIIPSCTHDIKIDDDLIIEGLKIIYNKNK